MSSEEEDYMSDAFLTKSVVDAKTTLIYSHAEKRKIAALERKKLHDELNRKKHHSVKVMELAYREEALNKPIEKDNKGFALLQKMGYKPGEGIGKREGAIKEPISVTLKNDRQGLGLESKDKYGHYKRIQKARGASSHSVSVNEYRTRTVQTFSRRQLEKDLRNSQRACQNLDTKEGHKKPLRSWYWIETGENGDDDEHSVDSDVTDAAASYSDDDSDDEQYTNSSEDDSDDDCSGRKRRKYISFEKGDTNLKDSVEDIEKKLRTLTSYLRKTYFYCIWCGIEFADEEDMLTACPGNKSDSH